MKTATVTDFRTNMKEHLNSLDHDQDLLILTGPKKKGFVVMPLHKFNSIEETVHLLSTAANEKNLMESIKQDRSGKDFVHITLSEGPIVQNIKQRKRSSDGKALPVAARKRHAVAPLKVRKK